MSSYLEKRKQQILLNKKLLAELGLDRKVAPQVKPALPTPKAHDATSTTPSPKKRKVVASPAVPSSVASSGGSRTSTRIKRKIERLNLADYDDQSDGDYEGELYDSDDDEEEEPGVERQQKSRKRVADPQRQQKRLSGHRPNCKVFGHQAGVEVGHTFRSRMEASQAGIHAPTVAGISGSNQVGCWSIALSGGYEDDVDAGYGFTFTGSGGRDLKGTVAAPKNLRTAPQSSDQSFEHPVNASLLISVKTKKPIRVLRGFKGHSCFAPETGYRYDGLYLCQRAWEDVGESGFKVCRFALVRMDGQPDIPIQAGKEEEGNLIIAEFGKGSNAVAPTSLANLPSSSPTKQSPTKA